MTIESPLARADGSSSPTKVDYTDYIILGVVAILSLVWFTKGKLWAVAKKSEPIAASTIRSGKTRNIVERMREQVGAFRCASLVSNIIRRTRTQSSSMAHRLAQQKIMRLVWRKRDIRSMVYGP